MKSIALVDSLGWAGAICVLVPYFLVSTGRLAGTARSFRVLNIVGGVLLMVNAWYHAAFPSLVVNALWIVIGLYTAMRARTVAG